MAASTFKYIYGPVSSWRLGVSLGIDPISQPEKICNLDCIYCQLGSTDILTQERKVYVPAMEIVREVETFPATALDYLTFSGRGEPTLALNLGEMIQALRLVRQEKIAVITNSVLMEHADVRRDLALADFILAKLDACGPETFGCVNRPMQQKNFPLIIEGLQAFRKMFKGKMALQMMFVDANLDSAQEMAMVARSIGADEVEINTPLRPSATPPLTRVQLLEIKKVFRGLPAKVVYDADRRQVAALDRPATMRRHGRYEESEG